MAVAFRSKTNTVQTADVTITATDPSGAAADDILIAHIYIETTATLTVPSGWSNTCNGTTMKQINTATGKSYNHYLYWIRRGSSAPSYTWSWSGTTYCEVVVAAYSGALTSGDPFSFGTTAPKNNTTGSAYPDVSGTTLDANELLIWCGGSWDWGNPTLPSGGFTQRHSPSTSTIFLADKTQTAAGATGTITGGSNSSGSTSTTTVMVGLRPAASGTANVKTVNNITYSSVKTFDNIAVASIKSINSITTQ